MRMQGSRLKRDFPAMIIQDNPEMELLKISIEEDVAVINGKVEVEVLRIDVVDAIVELLVKHTVCTEHLYADIGSAITTVGH